MALKDEINRETVKLQDMTFKKKAAYIWEYYKFHIIGVIAAVVFVCVFIRDLRMNKRPVYLDVVILNSDMAYRDDNPLQDDYVKYAGVDTRAYNISFDTAFLISESGTDQMTVANMQKLMALFAAGSIDVILGPDSLVDTYGNLDAFADISEVIPADLQQRLLDSGYEMYYATVYEEDKNGELKPVSTYPAGFYLDDSDYMNSLGVFATQKALGKRPVFALASCCTNTDNALKLLKMLTGL
ncbi:MAG: hypothetical protein IKT17_03015 [Lachnospiraceae bacterium]|nr:hypothetical protein [Lachnospiraceae bacterium]